MWPQPDQAALETEDDEVWDEHRIEPQAFIDAGDRVVVLQREYQRSKSGAELVIDTAGIVDLRDGRIVRMQGYMDPPKRSKPPGCGSSEIPRRRCRRKWGDRAGGANCRRRSNREEAALSRRHDRRRESGGVGRGLRQRRGEEALHCVEWLGALVCSTQDKGALESREDYGGIVLCG